MYRLATYPNIDKAWQKISTRDFNGIIGGCYRNISTGELDEKLKRIVRPNSEILSNIIWMAKKFSAIPRRTRSKRNKELKEAADLCQALAEMINGDLDIKQIFSGVLTKYVRDTALENNEKKDKKAHVLMHYPYAKYRTEYLAERIGDLARAMPGSLASKEFRARYLDQLSKITEQSESEKYLEKYAEFLEVSLDRANFGLLLKTAQQNLLLCMNKEVKVSHPGRSDGGKKPYLIREISRLMMDVYGQPLDEMVALFVSALMDLKTPLTRDDVRPYRTGKNK